MKFQNLYAVFAVVLPVSLGLGLVYLSSVGRIDGYTALIATIAIAAAMGGAVAVRDAPDRGGRSETEDLE